MTDAHPYDMWDWGPARDTVNVRRIPAECLSGIKRLNRTLRKCLSMILKTSPRPRTI